MNSNMEMCRICLVENVRMYSIVHTPLQDIYQSLTMMPFEMDNSRPTLVCYICHARLQSCYKLKINSLQSESWFAKGLSNDGVLSVSNNNSPKMQLSIYRAISLSSMPESQIDLELVKKEPKDFLNQVKIKQEVEDDNNVDVVDTNTNVDETVPCHEATDDTLVKKALGSKEWNNNKRQIIRKGHNRVRESKDVASTEINPEKVIETVATDQKHKTYKRSNNNKIPNTKNDKIRFKCDKCDKHYSTQSSLNRHIVTHSHVNMYKCDKCKKYFANKNNLTVHNCRSTPPSEKQFQCQICNKLFALKHNVISHMRVHTGEKPYKCDICNQCFTIQKNLKRHYLVHTGEKPYQCSICKRRFAVKFNLTCHIRRKHTGERPFKCYICTSSFFVKVDLISHMNLHDKDQVHKCTVCNKILSSKACLVRHIRGHSEVKRYKCDICNKCYSRRSDLNKHYRGHNCEKSYQCDICGHNCVSKSRLILHMKKHAL